MRTELIEYLLAHEDDIARGINDFGALRESFIDVYMREPQKQSDAADRSEK